MVTQDFWRALSKLNIGCKVTCEGWNGLSKQKMWIEKQSPDENSKMTVSYLFMVIESETQPTIRVPRTPSQKDLRAGYRKIK